MYTGTLIDDLLKVVERAEKAAATLPHRPREAEEVTPVNTGAAEPFRKISSETE
jgi:hypothetical protein